MHVENWYLLIPCHVSSTFGRHLTVLPALSSSISSMEPDGGRYGHGIGGF